MQPLYWHEVPVALRDMHRMLKPAGFLFVIKLDLVEPDNDSQRQIRYNSGGIRSRRIPPGPSAYTFSH
jgi:predicted SAM-dependent methyltransferase